MRPMVAENARARADVYSWLSAAFYFPTEEMLRREFVAHLGEALRCMKMPAMEQQVQLLERFVELRPGLEGLSIEYCRLFYGPGPLQAPPYESVYRNGYRLMGDSTMEAIRMYRDEGLQILDSFKDMPDHVCVEMEFMSHLCGKEAEAWEEGNQGDALKYLTKQKAFLEEKLCLWIPAMCDAVARTTRSDFYLAVASIARTFVEMDCSRMKDLESFHDKGGARL